MPDESEETGERLKTETRARGAGLYERIIGDAWLGLDEPVRRLHTSGPCGEGLFAVRRGNFVARAELSLHAARDFIYAVVFATLPRVEWRGAWALAFAALLGAE